MLNYLFYDKLGLYINKCTPTAPNRGARWEAENSEEGKETWKRKVENNLAMDILSPNTAKVILSIVSIKNIYAYR